MTRGQLFWFGATSPFHKVQQSIAALNPPILNAPGLNVQENCAPRGGPFSPTTAQQHLTMQWGLQPPARRPWGSCFAGSGAGQSISSVCCSPRSPWARSRRSGGDRERGIILPRAGQHTGCNGKGPSACLACSKVCRWEQVPFCRGKLGSHICWHPHDKHAEKKMSVCPQIMLYGTNLQIQSNEIKKEEPVFSLSQSETRKRRNLRAIGNISCP